MKKYFVLLFIILLALLGNTLQQLFGVGIGVGSVVGGHDPQSVVGGRNPHPQDIRTLVRQTARWSVAATQDESPLIALLHANYGAGYLWALLDIASENEVQEAMNGEIDMDQFKKKVLDIQNAATKKVSAVCPKFYGGLDPYLLELGGDK